MQVFARFVLAEYARILIKCNKNLQKSQFKVVTKRVFADVATTYRHNYSCNANGKQSRQLQYSSNVEENMVTAVGLLKSSTEVGTDGFRFVHKVADVQPCVRFGRVGRLDF